MKISVVIPAYNEEQYLGECLQSLMAQGYSEPFEIIVVDNGSTDRTAAIAGKLGVRVLSEPRRGVCAARQTGTVSARGDIVVSTDSDTVFPPDWLSTIARTFTDHPDAVAVTGPVTFVDAPWWGRALAGALFGINRAIFVRTGKVRHISGCNTAFRKDAWSGYQTGLTQGGDELDLLRQLSARGPVVFQQDMQVRTSSRRLHHGPAYHFFVTMLWYYFINYALGRWMGRSPFGSYSPVRKELARQSPVQVLVHSAAIIAMLGLALTGLIHPAAAQHIMKTTGTRIVSLADKIQHHERGS